MVIFLTGGGSGGHITPLLAVARELKRLDASVRLVYIGAAGDHVVDLVRNSSDIDVIHVIFSGKFRRYHGESFLKQLLDQKTLFFNARDAFLVVVGLMQAFYLVCRYWPSSIFIKGGFVGVPIGLAAAVTGRPYLTHDSDVVPGLANKIIGRWAAKHATGMPAELYAYPKHKTVYTGVPVQAQFQTITKQQARDELRIPQDSQVVLVTGGGLGSVRLNRFAANALRPLLQSNPKLQVVHVSGKLDASATQAAYEGVERARVLDFVSDMHLWAAAADVVVTRAGATSLAEMAVLGKACIVVPNPNLTGGHQLKNARALEALGACVVLDERTLEEDAAELMTMAVHELLTVPSKRHALEQALKQTVMPQAAADLARLTYDLGDRSKDVSS